MNATATMTKGFMFTATGRRSLSGAEVHPFPGKWSFEAPVVPNSPPFWFAAEERIPVEAMGAELWEIEVEPVIPATDDYSGTQRYRMVRKVEGWDAETMVAFAQHCAERAVAHVASTDDPDERQAAADEHIIASDASLRTIWATGLKDLDNAAQMASAAAIAGHGAYAYANSAIRRSEAVAAERNEQSVWLAYRLGLR